MEAKVSRSHPTKLALLQEKNKRTNGTTATFQATVTSASTKVGSSAIHTKTLSRTSDCMVWYGCKSKPPVIWEIE